MSLEQEVGRLSGTVEALQRDIAEMKADVKTLLSARNQTKGGWRAVAVLAAFVGGAAGFLVDLLNLGRR